MINRTILGDAGFVRYFGTVLRRQLHKRVLHSPLRTRTPAGKPFLVASEIPYTFEITSSDWRMDWGSEVVLARAHRAFGGGVFADVGANIGYYSALMAPYAGRVVAFEPDDRYLPWLKRNAAPHANVEIVEKGVFRETTTLSFLRPTRGGGHGGLAGFWENEDAFAQQERIDLACVSLDDMFAGGPDPVTSIKIDTDGSEIEILEGARRLLQSDDPVILTEYGHHDDPQRAFARLGDFCARTGRLVFAFVRADRGGYARPRFAELARDDLAGAHFKMLFLVSPERAPFFAQFAGVDGFSLTFAE